MQLDEIIKKLGSIDLPTGAMGATGIVLLLIVMKAAKGLWKFVLLVLALALLAGAVWWHFHKEGRM
jgi:multisubunit Na+/H+ antiporter MnhB subunit